MPLDDDQAAALNGAIKSAAIAHRNRASALLETVGLSIGQEGLLFELAAHGGRSQAQLAAAVGCEPPTVTMAVRKLEVAGLVTRAASTQDARALVVTLTAAGRKLMPRLRRVWRQLAEEGASGLTPAERATVLRLLPAVAHGLAPPPARRAAR